ncbi:uncharacterized protein SPAPADRAFT_72723 [Spathaspora passalidarum NRRL Y-27907]|uniref:Zf-CHY-domain-containing protein n=1 Tax=Spathaspora passalidarum (strain NRRL Y-27907 / 11-Y1) TaxID=619300 RepID=G3AT41_SPAPN|nr:uncharacterized protein SPAPADRAFT_72723 [Spathaspora passalidarum NRRL Y-27907]EGW30804.1 hypothetical protein SPAPADRAFT_72723 [Spathaspora passalidarum NRRL Y-27907]
MTTSIDSSHRHVHKTIPVDDRNSDDSLSDSSIDSMTADLDQIGKLNLPNITSISSWGESLIQMPNFEFSRIQDFSKEFSKYVFNYASSYRRDAGESSQGKEEDDETMLDSIKTVLSTRIQMNKFLNDLKLGVNITTAIDRLQPLTDMIHETIFLPAEDESEYDEEPLDEEEIEPVGVGEIVHKSQPLISEIVKPEMSTRTGSSMASFRKRKRKLFRDLSEDSGEGTSVTSDVDGLTVEEVKELTELNSINDFGEEGVLRNKIQRIQKLDNIDEKSKNKLVTKLMMGNYYKYVNEKLSQENKQLLRPLRKQTLVINGGDGLDNLAEEDEEEQEEAQEDEDMEDEGEDEDEDEDNVVLTAEDTVPSYNDPPFNTTLGCPHYHRNCKVECPTCLKWYPCRFCHDNEITDHKLIRNEVKHILCMHCQTPQVPDTNYCINCEQELANYFCRKCVLYDNDPNKDIYHCDKCGICRLGLGIGKDYFHCDTCNVCLSIDLHDKHKCVTNTTHCNCTICNEYLFTSVQKVVFMKCGHSIHQHCYDELITHSYKCPICKKTIVNVETQFRLLDQEVMQSPLPPPYNAWRCIISCNDCKGKSNCSYHVLGLKCKYCKSYNTNQLKLIKPEEEEEEEEEEIIDGDVMHDFDAKVMRDVRINLSKNFRIDTQVVEDENSGYEDDEEDEEFEDEDTRQEDEYDEVIPENLVDLKKLTNAILSDDYHRINSNVSYITNMFQNFINNATKK